MAFAKPSFTYGAIGKRGGNKDSTKNIILAKASKTARAAIRFAENLMRRPPKPRQILYTYNEPCNQCVRCFFLP